MRIARRPGDFAVGTVTGGRWPVSYWIDNGEGGVRRKRSWLPGSLTLAEAEERAATKAKTLRRRQRSSQAHPREYLVERLAEALYHRQGMVSAAETAYHLQGSVMYWLAFWVDWRRGWTPGQAPTLPAAYGRTREERWVGLQRAASRLATIVRDVEARDADGFMSWMGSHLSASSSNSAMREMRGTWAVLVRWKLATENPFEGMAGFDRKKRTPGARVDPRRRKGYTDAEELAIFSALWGDLPESMRVRMSAEHREELALYCELLCRTGYRADQVYRLTFDSQRLRFPGQKGARDSTQPVTDATRAVLARWQALTGGQWTFRRDWYLHRLGDLRDALGIQGVPRAHGWRHAMVRRVVNLAGHDWARKIVGHSLSAEGMSGEYFAADGDTEARVLSILNSIIHPRPESWPIRLLFRLPEAQVQTP